LEKIAPFVLLHRSNANENSQEQQQQEQQEKEKNQEEEGKNKDAPQSEHQFSSIMPINKPKNLKASKGSSKNGTQSKLNQGQQQITAQASTHKNMDVRKTVGQYLATDKFEFKEKFAQSNSQMHLMFIVDSSGSMLKDKMVSYAKGLVEKFSNAAKGKKPLFSLISLFDGDAELLQESSNDLNALQNALEAMKTGGKTNIIAAFKLIKGLKNRHQTTDFKLIIITDAKFNSSENNALDEAVLACQTYCKGIQDISVIDAEKGLVRIGMAAKFNHKINATYETLEIPQYD